MILVRACFIFFVQAAGLLAVAVILLVGSEIVSFFKGVVGTHAARFAPFAFCSLICIGLALLFLYSVRWFVRSGKLPAAGVALLASIVGLVLSAATSVACLNLRDDYEAALVAIDEMGQAQLQLKHGVLTITGPLGDGILSKVKALETSQEALNEIRITSEGGFVDDALDLAGYVESRAIKVVVQDYCYSACVLVAVASPKSYAMANAEYGFHKTYATFTPTTQLVRYGQLQWSKDSDAFLKSHGIPERVIEEANKMGPDDLYYVSAEDAAKANFIDGIIQEP